MNVSNFYIFVAQSNQLFGTTSQGLAAATQSFQASGATCQSYDNAPTYDAAMATNSTVAATAYSN